MVSLSRLRNRPPLPTKWEVWELGIYACLLPLVFVPRRIGIAGCRLLARFLMRSGSKYRAYQQARIPRPIAFAVGGATRALRESETLMLYERLLVLRGSLFPRWRRKVRLEGVEHVRAGLDAGHGVILWVQPCLGSSVSVKQALFEAGLPLAHLTRPGHGFSGHPFGMWVANPFFRRAENPFLAERVVIDDATVVGPLRRLQILLRENRVISITVTNTASRVHEFPMLDGSVLLPAGPIEMAGRARAVILPVFTVGSARPPLVEIGPPLPVDGIGAKAVEACQRATLQWLQGRIDEHPLDWVGWRAHIFRPSVTGEPA